MQESSRALIGRRAVSHGLFSLPMPTLTDSLALRGPVRFRSGGTPSMVAAIPCSKGHRSGHHRGTTLLPKCTEFAYTRPVGAASLPTPL